MTELSEEGASKVKTDKKARPLLPVRQVVNAKERFLKEIKDATPSEHTKMRERNSLIANTEKALMGWIEDQTRHNTALNESVIQSQVISSNLWRLRDVRKLKKESTKQVEVVHEV